jgi:hypothetical protein
MLTDRQQKFYIRIAELSNSAGITSEEKKYFLKTKKRLDKEVNFKDSINGLLLPLQSIERKRGLSPQAQEIFENLAATYGKGEITGLPKPIQMVGFYEREKAKKEGVEWEIPSSFRIIGFLSWILISILFGCAFFLNLLILKFGNIGIISLYIVGILLAGFGLYFSGKWQKKVRK